MKIVELNIDELDDFTGFEAVALVNQPAIEAGFHAFNSDEVDEAIAFQVIKSAVQELFVDRLPGESKEDYIGRCIPQLMREGYDQDQAAAICYDSFNLKDEAKKKSEKVEFQSYTDYPKAASDNAAVAVRWAEENGWGDCGTPVGKARAHQLANREPISEDTIARMAAFERHRQHSDKKLGDGCGRLMWLAWGGDAGIRWAQRKLEEIRNEDLSKDKHYDDLPDNIQDKILDSLAEKGISIDDLSKEGYTLSSEDKFIEQALFNVIASDANPDGYTNDNVGSYKVLYQYTGPKDSKNRSFCRRLLDLDLLFRKEDIDRLTLKGANNEFGMYNIFEYKGSFGCRHKWNKVYVYKSQKTIGADMIEKQAESTNLSKQSFSVNEDQQIVVGPLMIPDKLIFRVDEDMEPYYVYFSPETIKKIAYKTMRNKLLDAMNLEHDPDSPVDGWMMETWIVEDQKNDKQQVYGFDYPVGTWMGMYKVEDREAWKKVKTGELTGFSIEGYFSDRLVQASKL